MNVTSIRFARASGVMLALAPFVVVAVVAGGCKKTVTMAPTACSAMIEMANGRTEAVAAAYNSDAATNCTGDADCVEVAVPSCVVGCGGVAIPKDKVGVAKEQLQIAEERNCTPWRKGNCASIAPLVMPSCPRLVPRCQGGVCTMVIP